MNIIRINVDPEVLATNAYGAGALVRIERSATGGGAGYAELGTVAIVAGTMAATYYHTTGASSDWYRTRYCNALNTLQSEYGGEFQAGGPQPYATFNGVKARLGITDTTDDALLETYVSQVNDWLEERLGRPVGPDNGATYVFDGDGTNRLRVVRGVRAVTSLTVAPMTGTTPLTVPAGDIKLVPATGDRMVRHPADWIVLSDIPTGGVNVFGRGYGTVTVVGDFGFASIPDALEDVATTCVVSKYRARGAGGGDNYTLGVDGERTFERFLGYEDKITIRRYAVGPLVA
jgi:hypothetical protein